MFREVHPLILASGSTARKSMLQNSGLRFECCPADIDEQVYQNLGVFDLAVLLAQKKAQHISAIYPSALVVGSDQTLDLDGRIFSKARDKEDAREKLMLMRGKTHTLNSAVCVIRNGEILWEHIEQAHLTMRDFDNDFLEFYMQKNEDALTHCVGAYKIEGGGAWLFSEVKGDLFTIMGMPLLPLLDYLHAKHGFMP